MKKSSTIKKAQMGAAMPAKKGEYSGSMKKFKPTSPIRRPKGPVYEGSTLPEFTVTAPKSKYGTKVAGKKPIKKAQTGRTETKMVVDGKEYKEGAMLDEAVVTGKRIKSLKDRVKPVKDKIKSIGDGLGLNRSYKPKPAKRSVQSVKTYRQRGSGPGSGLMKLKQRITRRYKEGGEVEMAKKGASVKKAMGKCKMGC